MHIDDAFALVLQYLNRVPHKHDQGIHHTPELIQRHDPTEEMHVFKLNNDVSLMVTDHSILRSISRSDESGFPILAMNRCRYGFPSWYAIIGRTSSGDYMTVRLEDGQYFVIRSKELQGNLPTP